ncbi:MAG: ribulose-phosphate 3-epimerase [Bacteroidia bacterium]|jgi:ribulose-phosphate 3-epimerase
MNNPIIAPSILSADFGNLQRDVEMINASEADWFHVDIMDGVFVPNISFGFPVMQSIHKHAKKPLDVHLMIVQPERYIKEFKQAGAAVLSVHYEASTHLHRTLQAIRAEGMKAGVALNPHTPVSVLQDLIADIDVVCMMSVNPGFGGQKFIDRIYSKCRELKAMIQHEGSSCLIEIDGGVNEVTAPKLLECGADVLVAGNYVFSSADPTATISSLKKLTMHTHQA